jgi:hypothetical protein
MTIKVSYQRLPEELKAYTNFIGGVAGDLCCIVIDADTETERAAALKDALASVAAGYTWPVGSTAEARADKARQAAAMELVKLFTVEELKALI